MKAYYVSLRGDEDAGGGIAFANTVQEARKQYYRFDLDPESWLDVQAHRRKTFDGMENLTKAELWKECWRDGWWFHEYDVPDVDTATDEDFYNWYERTFNDKA